MGFILVIYNVELDPNSEAYPTSGKNTSGDWCRSLSKFFFLNSHPFLELQQWHKAIEKIQRLEKKICLILQQKWTHRSHRKAIHPNASILWAQSKEGMIITLTSRPDS